MATLGEQTQVRSQAADAARPGHSAELSVLSFHGPLSERSSHHRMFDLRSAVGKLDMGGRARQLTRQLARFVDLEASITACRLM